MHEFVQSNECEHVRPARGSSRCDSRGPRPLLAASGDDRPLITWPVTWPSGDREYAALHRLGGPTRAPTLAALIVALGRL